MTLERDIEELKYKQKKEEEKEKKRKEKEKELEEKKAKVLKLLRLFCIFIADHHKVLSIEIYYVFGAIQTCI